MYSASASSHQSPSTTTTLSHIYSHVAGSRPPGPVRRRHRDQTWVRVRVRTHGDQVARSDGLATNWAIRLISSPVPRSVADSKSVQCAFESHRGTHETAGQQAFF